MRTGADIIVWSLAVDGDHGTNIGRICSDKAASTGLRRHPVFDTPDTSYGGLRWGHDLPEGLAPLAYKLRMLTVPLRNLGAAIAPDNSWIFLQGIETLSLRMDRHCENSMKVAEHLEKHPKVAWVRYPGLKSDPQYAKNVKYLKGKGGGIVIFGIKTADAPAAGKSFIDNLKVIAHVANVGDARTLAIHPATTTHSQMNAEQQAAAGVPPEMVRLSVGLETYTDILEDIDQALATVA